MRRRDFLMLSGGTLAGGTILGTGSVTESEVSREADILVADDGRAIVGLSNKSITPELSSKFDPKKDNILDIKNRLSNNINIQRVRLEIQNESGNDIVIPDSVIDESVSIKPGDKQSIKTTVTPNSKTTTLQYRLIVESSETEVAATREVDITTADKMVTTGTSTDETHALRVFPPGSNSSDLQTLRIEYADENFDVSGVKSVDIRVGESTVSVNNTTSTQSPNVLKIDNLGNTGLGPIGENVIIVKYDGVDNPNGFNDNVTVRLNGNAPGVSVNLTNS